MKRIRHIYCVLLTLLLSSNSLHSADILITSSSLSMHTNWQTVGTGMGHSMTVQPLSVLNTTAFIPNYDALIISQGTYPTFTTTQIDNVKLFIQSGKSVYLQTEYLPTFVTNAAFQTIVNDLGGAFLWSGLVSGALTPAVTTTLGTTPNAVSPLTYYWYGCSAASYSCSVVPFLFQGSVSVAWLFSPPNPSYGQLITTTDQDWVNSAIGDINATSLMENIIYHLIHPDLIEPISMTTIDMDICSGESYMGYSVSGTYHDTFSTLGTCDSIRTLNLTVLPAYDYTLTEEICAGESFMGYTASGYFSDTFLSINNCDSIRHIDLTVNPLILNSITASICEGESYSGYTVTGIYSDTFVSTSGCDSVRTLNLTVNPVYTFTVNQSICSGESYLGYSASGTYHDTFTAVNHCDSIRTLILNVTSVIHTAYNDTICDGESTEGYATTGIYTDTFISTSGCDSIRTLNLTVNPVYTFTVNQSICSGESYLGYSASGTYYDTFTAVNHCDSIRTLILNVTPVIHTAYNDTICDGESTEGYITTGIYTDTFISTSGCDSVRILNLTVKPIHTFTINQSICSGETYLGYSTSGTYYDTFTAANNCDSIRILNLLVHPTYHQTQTLTYCRNELPATYLGVTIPAAAVSTTSYETIELSTVYNCDSIIVLNLVIYDTSRTDIDTLVCHDAVFEWNGMTISSPGNYFYNTDNMNNCDSIVVLNVQFLPDPVAADTLLRACTEAEYRGNFYYNDTVFIDTFRNGVVCDSLYRTVRIDILEVVYDTLYAEICQGDKYNFNGAEYSSSGIYTQTYTNSNGCDSFITLELIVNPLPNVQMEFENFSEDDITCVGDSILLIGSGAEHYVYFDVFEDPIIYKDSAWARVFEGENRLYVVGTDENGCSMRAQVTVYAQNCCDILVPNAFSPNGDGLNDAFGIVTLGNPQNFSFQIFDRWGNRVFISSNHNIKWDGTYNGNKLESGVYFYTISSVCYDGSLYQHKGEVHLLR